MAASFYAPIGKVKKWSWETTWADCRFLLVDSAAHRRELHAAAATFTPSMPRWAPHLLLKVALFGAMWGVGNVSYGLTMRHLGMSLGIGVAIGVTLVVGTLVPPLMHGQGSYAASPPAADLLTHGGSPGGADRRRHRLLCRPSERSATRRGGARSST